MFDEIFIHENGDNSEQRYGRQICNWFTSEFDLLGKQYEENGSFFD